jgi:hypothetical protein
VADEAEKAEEAAEETETLVKKTLGLIVVPVLVGVGLFLIGWTLGRRLQPEITAIRVDLLSLRQAYQPLANGSGVFQPGQVKFTAGLPAFDRRSDWFLIVARIGTDEVPRSISEITFEEQSFSLHRRLSKRPEAIRWLLVRHKGF